MISGAFREAIEYQLSLIEGVPVMIASTRAASGGCINNGAHVTTTSRGRYFVKWNAHARHLMFTREAEGLEELRKADSGLRIPKVYAAQEGTDSLPAFLLLEDVLIAPASTLPHHHDEELGRGLARLHKKQSERFGFAHDNYIGPTVQPNSWSDSWPDFFAEKRIAHLLGLLDAGKKLDTDSRRTGDDFCSRLPQLIGHELSPSLVHGDLWSGNSLRSDNGTPALIDPAVYYGDAEVDLAMMQLFGGFSARVFAAYREEKPIDGGFEQRRDVYNVYHLLNHALLFGGGYLAQATASMRRFV